jgi:hypothetical protein
MFRNERIYIAPNIGVSDYINEGKEEELIQLISELSLTDPTIEVCSPEDFEPDFVKGLDQDKKILDELTKEWNIFEQDPKLDVFIDYLRNRLFDWKSR